MTELIHSYAEDGVDLIVEGVAVLPEFAALLDVPSHSIFLGNRSDTHSAIILQIAREKEHDWMHNQSDTDITHAAQFFNYFSTTLQIDAAAHNMRYIDITDENYEQDLRAAAALLLKN